MTLRTRLLVGLALVTVVLGLVVLLVPRTVERAQISELDRQLRGVTPQATTVFDDGAGRPPAPEESFSDLYIALVSGGEVSVVFLKSQLAPGRSPSLLTDPATSKLTMATVRSANGQPGMWRTATVAGPRPGSAVVVAAPLDRIRTTTGDVRRALAAAAGAVVAMLILVGWWVTRLGLRPIAEVTEVATAIAGGQRDRRAEDHAGNTEADRLAREVNSMLDQLVAAEDRLRIFVSDASHELRTPVTAIKGFTDLYRNGDLAGSGDLDEAMRRIGQESRRMETLVDDLLLLARLDEERGLATSDVDVASLVHDALLDAAATHPSRTVTADCESDLVVPGDDARLRQVLANLVSNALVHAGPAAAVTISARAFAGGVAIEVADNGIGIAETDQARIFEEFQQVGRERSREGTGLGLTLTRRFVELHGGRIWLESAPGQGSTFTFTLPLRQAAPVRA